MLVPGVVSENGTIGNGVGISSDTAVSINGNQSNSNLWLLDGQNNMDIGSNAQNVVTPPLDALEEFKVLSSNYSAEFGGGPAASSTSSRNRVRGTSTAASMNTSATTSWTRTISF